MGKQSNSEQHPFLTDLNLETAQNSSSWSVWSISGCAKSRFSMISEVNHDDYALIYSLQSRYTANVNVYADVSFIFYWYFYI